MLITSSVFGFILVCDERAVDDDELAIEHYGKMELAHAEMK